MEASLSPVACPESQGEKILSRKLEKIPELFLIGSERPSLNQCVLKDAIP